MSTSEREILPGFAVIEGIDGAGTTTQLEYLRERLIREGVLSYCTSEPTDGPIGRILRQVLGRDLILDARAVALLFAADRSEHLRGPAGILDRLSEGQLVVSDRYIFSSLTYQGIACGLDYVMAINDSFALPELVIYLDTPLSLTQTRLDQRVTQELFDSRDFQRQVVAGYDSTFAQFPELRLERVDGKQPPQVIAEQVWKLVSSLPIMGV